MPPAGRPLIDLARVDTFGFSAGEILSTHEFLLERHRTARVLSGAALFTDPDPRRRTACLISVVISLYSVLRHLMCDPRISSSLPVTRARGTLDVEADTKRREAVE